MKILVFSDIHNRKNILKKLVAKVNPDYVFFLGDGLDVVKEEVGSLLNDKLYMVKGNSDLLIKLPTTMTFKLENTTFLLTHGHGFHVKNGLIDLYDYAKKEEVQVVCFGHTHKPFNESINHILFFNPGSLGSTRAEENTFGVLEIDGEKITQKIEKF